MNQPHRNCVLLADRNLGLTEGMRDLLKTTFETVVMVGDHSSLFDSAERLEPSVAVIDLSLADGGGTGSGSQVAWTVPRSSPDRAEYL